MNKQQTEIQLERLGRGASAREKFTLALLVSLASPAQVAAALETVTPKRPLRREIVAGRPYTHWLGKTRADLEREGLSDEQIDEVEAALETGGRTLEDGDEGEEGTAGAVARRGRRASRLTSQTPAKPETAPDQEEPTFAGHKLSELAGKSDDDLLKIEGIGPATVREIRKAEKSAK